MSQQKNNHQQLFFGRKIFRESNYIKGNVPAEKQSSTTFFGEENF
jgi:hypothetical protein